MKSLSRRERERQEHVKHVLNVARELFAKRGFFKVTMKEIAERAEFALGTVYSFFKGKRSLYQQAIEEKVDELVTAVSAEMARETSPVLVVTRFIEAKLRVFFENLDFIRLYFVGMHGLPVCGDQAVSLALQDKCQALLERVSRAFEQGMSEGAFAEASPKALTAALDGQTSALVFSWLRDVPPDSPENEIETAKRIFLNGVLAKRCDPSASDGQRGSKEM